MKQPDYLVLVNGDHRLPRDFARSVELVTVENAVGEPIQVEKKTYEAFLRLQKDLLENDGIAAGLSNSYRTVERQEEIFARYTREFGLDYAKKYAAKPGHSEHHTGLAIDVGVTLEGKFHHTIEEILSVEHLYQVIQKKLPQYGFILRYPKGKEAVTGIGYEPWHFRYLGDPELAAELTEQGLCLEEYSAHQAG